MPQPGDVLSGRYELLEMVGRGGMSEVFRAHDRRLDREVAVKVLAGHLLDDPGAERQLEREARAAAALRHPGLVAVHDTGQDGDAHYLVMEYVDGPTLADVLRRDGPMAPADAVDVTLTIAAAVQAAHQRGIVHRDLKPSNVMFDAEGRIRVTDFGIAHAGDPATATQTALLGGSAPYLAPEQAEGREPTPAADVYALGCLLFELLTGRPPFVRTTPAAVIAAHLYADPPRPSTVQPGPSEELDAVVVTALAKDPTQRPPDAGALAAELRGVPNPEASSVAAGTSLAGGAAVADVPTTPMAGAGTEGVDPRPAGAGSRSRWMWLAGGAAGLVALALLTLPLRGSDEPGQEASAVPTPSQATPPTPADTPSPSVSPTPASPAPSPAASPTLAPTPTTLFEAAAALRERIETARQAFEIDEDDAEDLDDRLAEIVEKYREDKPKDVRDKLRELRRKVDELARESRIGSDLQRELQEGLDRLEATV